MESIMKLGVRNIRMSYPGQEIFRNFTLEFRENAITCILGPSGCGKTTLLNILSGNLRPQSGERIGFGNRKLSYIFQEPRLLPWKTVTGNLLFPVKEQIPPEKQEAWLGHYLDLVNLQGKGHLYPYQLSGGMKQRVAMARAFAFPSDIILMDEAFRGLDLSLKMNLMESFLRIWKEHPRTVIAVTHDVDEALALGHDLIVFSHPPLSVVDRIGQRKQEETVFTGNTEIRNRLISRLMEAGRNPDR